MITLAAAIALAGLNVVAQAQPPPGGPHGHRHHNELADLPAQLNLTPEQTTKVQPILDAAKPQMKAIHEEAMTKAKAVMDNSFAQIRPLLTAEQQTKLDAMIKAHQDMHNAGKEMHDAEAK